MIRIQKMGELAQAKTFRVERLRFHGYCEFERRIKKGNLNLE
jgi:hypothetical protein